MNNTNQEVTGTFVILWALCLLITFIIACIHPPSGVLVALILILLAVAYENRWQEKLDDKPRQ